jgi:hypothetical protein
VVNAPGIAGLLVVPALFAPHAGWHTGHARPQACTGSPATRCVYAPSWAATIPWRGCGWCIPHQMVAALPPDGVVLQISISKERPMTARVALPWPPRIRARDVVAGFEGVSPRYGVSQQLARYGQVERYVWGWFGRARPTTAQLARANAELARLSRPR